MKEQNVADLAAKINLPIKTTKKIVSFLEHDLLLSLYRKNPDEPLESVDFRAGMIEDKAERARYIQYCQDKVKNNHELNKKIEDLYQKKYKKKLNIDIISKNKILPLFLMGPPGQGKTASYLAAAKSVCADLGLTFIREVTDNYVPRFNDFIFVSHECAGENSAITFGGVPKAEEAILGGERVSVLKKSVNYRFKVFDDCAGGVLLFDDAASAPQVIQNVLLPVAQFGNFQGTKISNALIGFTGNLGALDGTYTTELSSALRTRTVPMFTMDTVQDFSNRCYETYNDELGDVGVSNFLKRNEQYFAILPEVGQKSGFPCSRSWENLIQSARSVIERNGGRGVGEAESLEEIQSLSSSMLGPKVGNALSAYFHSMLIGADPVAKAFIDNPEDKKNAERFRERYGRGTSQEELTFGYQFAAALGDYTANYISAKMEKTPQEEKMKMFEEAMTRFGKGALLLNDSELAYAIEHVNKKIAANIPEFGRKEDSFLLDKDANIVMFKALKSLPEYTSNVQDVIANSLTGQSRASFMKAIEKDDDLMEIGQKKTTRRSMKQS